MLNTPGVARVFIVSCAMVLLGALGCITYLASTGHGTEAIGGLLLGILGLVMGKMQSINTAVGGVHAQLNSAKDASDKLAESYRTAMQQGGVAIPPDQSLTRTEA